MVGDETTVYRKSEDMGQVVYKILSRKSDSFSTTLKIIAKGMNAFACILWATRGTNIFVAEEWFEDGNSFGLHNLALAYSYSGQVILNQKVEHRWNLFNQSSKFGKCTLWLGERNISSLLSTPVVFNEDKVWALSVYWKVNSKIEPETMDSFKQIGELMPSLYSAFIDRKSVNLFKETQKTIKEATQEAEKAKRREKDQVLEKYMRRVAGHISKRLDSIGTSIYLAPTLEADYVKRMGTTKSHALQKKTITKDMDGYIAWVFKNRKPMFIFDIGRDDLASYQRDYPGLKWERRDRALAFARTMLKLPPYETELPPLSLVVVPVNSGSHCIGVISSFIAKKPPFIFGDSELDLLALVSGLVSDYWESWLSHHAAGKEADDLKSLMDGIKHISKLTLAELAKDEPNGIGMMTEALKYVKQTIPGCGISDIRLIQKDPAGDFLYFAVFNGDEWNHGHEDVQEEKKGRRFLLSGNSTGANVVRQKKTLRAAKSSLFTFQHVTEIISAPLFAGKDVIGVLDIRPTMAVGFPPEADAMAELLGQHLGLCWSMINSTNDLKVVLLATKKLQIEQQRFYEDFSHQVRSPVFQILHRTEDVVTGELPWQKSEIRLIRSVARKATRVVDSYLLFAALSKSEPLKLNAKNIEVEDLKTFLRNMADDYGKMARPKSGIRFELDLSEIICLELLDLKVDLDLLEQAVGNVFDNAVKYSFANTTIKVEVGKIKNQFYLATTNTGLKLAKTEILHVKKRNWRGHEGQLFGREGSGIGLWIVDHIMQAHGGQLQVSPTTPGGNTQVRLYFPVSVKLVKDV